MKVSSFTKEWCLIALGWVLIYASDPLYMYYAHMVNGYPFTWDKVMDLWTYTTAFLILFLVNHFLLIPKLVARKEYTWYAVSVFALLALFITFLLLAAPELKSPVQHEVMQAKPQDVMETNPPLLTPPDLGRVMMALLMMGMDFGIVAWLNEQRLHQRLLQLEKQNLKQELEQLRYQINPHFLMNTLNNIHALIDLDAEQARHAIIELSGLMRYTLYEGRATLVPLTNEVEFLNHYIALMKMRYNDSVEVTCEMPVNAPIDVVIPPLMLATYVENAFKHGISYQEPSFIHIRLTLEKDDQVISFQCTNSKHVTPDRNPNEPHGIGLVNARKRLDLQYMDKYSLIINSQSNKVFTVELAIPSREKTV